MKSYPRWMLCVVIGLTFSWMSGCGNESGTNVPDASINASTANNNASDGGSAGPVTVRPEHLSSASPAAVQSDDYPEVEIKTNQGVITIQLDRKSAPLTVSSFLDNYVDAQFYDGTLFHYVDTGMILGGGYTQELKPKPHRGEVMCEANNGLKNERGTIAMNRYPEALDSGTSQFFINLKDNTSFDHKEGSADFDTKDYKKAAADFGFCVFGRVIEGLEVAERISQARVHDTREFVSTPVDAVVIESIRRTK